MKISSIPLDIKKAVAKYFVIQCSHLSAIAFLQWRLKYPKESVYRSSSELEELIHHKINKFCLPFEEQHKVSKNTYLNG